MKVVLLEDVKNVGVAEDIALALKDQEGVYIDKRKITLAEPIRHIGKITVKVKTYAGVEGKLTVAVVGEGK